MIDSIDDIDFTKIKDFDVFRYCVDSGPLTDEQFKQIMQHGNNEKLLQTCLEENK